MLYRKAISPVVATALLIVVAVGALVGFQTWFNQYSSSLFSDVEQSGSGDDIAQGINNFQNGNIYFNHKTNDNVTVTEVKVGNVTCSKNITLEQGMNKISGCEGNFSNIVDVVLYTNKDVYSKEYFIKELSYTLPFICKNDSDSSGFHAGNGTQSSPYEVCSCNQLQNVTNHLSSHFKQVNDIDCSATSSWNGGSGFNPIGFGSSFNGKYNGQNYEISNLFINRSSSDNIGLFSLSNSGDITNLIMRDAKIYGDQRIGVLSGRISNSNNISNIEIIDSQILSSDSSIVGIVTGRLADSYLEDITIKNAKIIPSGSNSIAGGVAGRLVSDQNYYMKNVVVENLNISNGGRRIGGVVGYLRGGYNFTDIEISGIDFINNGNSNGGVIGEKDNSGTFHIRKAKVSKINISSTSSEVFGGIIGYMRSGEGFIDEVKTTDSTLSSSNRYVGGVGGLINSNLYIDNSYVYDVIINGQSYAGGITGGGVNAYINTSLVTNTTISANYVGGIYGSSSENVDNSYWNNQTVQFTGTDTTDSGAGTPKNTSQLQNPTDSSGIYANWSSTIWDFGTNSEYPRFKWE